MSLSKTNLKRGLYEDKNGITQEKYVIEDKADLMRFFKAFSIITDIKVLKDSFVSAFNSSVGTDRTLIATDPHPMSGFNTYCFASLRTDKDYPNNLYFVKLLD